MDITMALSFQSAVAHELISNEARNMKANIAFLFQSAVAHELISNSVQASAKRAKRVGFKALSRMSSFPTRDAVRRRGADPGVSKRCRA